MIIGLFQKNSKQEAFRKKKNFKFVTIFRNSVMLCYTPWKFQHQKPRLKKIQDDFFLIIP